MLRRILRLLPHSSQASNKFSPVFRRRTTVAPLGPLLVIACLGVSVAGLATCGPIITIHEDATQAPADQPEKLDNNEMPRTSSHDYLLPQPPPSPTADETFDLSSKSSIHKRKAVGVSQIDTILLASNHPCEDTFHHIAVGFSSTLNYSLFGVYDGHNGSTMSKFLGDNLTYAVLAELVQLYFEHPAAFKLKLDHADVRDSSGFEMMKEPSEGEIDQSIKKAFILLDSFVVNEMTQKVLDRRISKEEGARLLSLANAGSCALLGIYNNVKRTFKVAVTGDSRAVLGRRVALKEDTYAYETHVLSADQTVHNPHEVERLEAAHPGENIVEGGAVLDWVISRFFGNAAYKWSLEIQQRLHEEYLGDRPRSDFLTPPYFTAEPEITTTTIRKGDFVVMASDGLWDCLTNEEVVGLVGGWLETRGEEVKIGKDEGIGEGEMVMLPFGEVYHRSGQDHRKGFGKGRGNGWPKDSNGDSGNKEDETTIWERTDLPVTSIKPDETPMYNWWHATKRFLNVDGNSAVHLARNALGGADRDLTGALLQLSPPRSRRYRDDICVQVIFFQ